MEEMQVSPTSDQGFIDAYLPFDTDLARGMLEKLRLQHRQGNMCRSNAGPMPSCTCHGLRYNDHHTEPAACRHSFQRSMQVTGRYGFQWTDCLKHTPPPLPPHIYT